MPRSRLLTMFLLFVGAAAAVVTYALLPEGEHNLTIALVLVLGGVCSISTIVEKFRDRFDIFEVIHPVCYVSFLYYGASTIYMLYDPRVAYDRGVFSYLNVSLGLCIAAQLSMVYGYYVMRKIGARSTRPPIHIGGTPWIVVLFGLGLCGQLCSVLAERRYSIEQWGNAYSTVQKLEFFGLMIYFLLMFLWFAGRATREQKLFLLFAVLPVELLLVYAWLGNKSFCLTVLGMPIVAAWYARRKLPSKSVFVLILLAVFVIFPFYTTFRAISRNYSTGTRVSRTIDALAGRSPDVYTNDAFFIVGSRMALINSVAVVVRDVPDRVDYEYGRTLELTLISLGIPRIFWPDKPSISTGLEFARVFRVLPRWNKETAVAITPVAEFYWNFSLPGVIVGMFLLGVSFQLVYRFLGEEKTNDPIRLSMYASILPTMVGFEGNIAGWSGTLIRSLAIYTIVMLILRRPLIRDSASQDAASARPLAVEE